MIRSTSSRHSRVGRRRVAVAVGVLAALVIPVAPVPAAETDGRATVFVVAEASDGGTLVCADATGRAGVAAEYPVDPSGGVVVGRSLWVSNERAEGTDVTAVNVESGSIEARVDVGAPAQTVVRGPGRSVWVRTNEGELVKIDTRRKSVSARIEVRSFSSHLAAGGGIVWVADGQGTVYRINGRSGRLDDAVLVIEGAGSGDLPVVGAIAATSTGDLWIALSGESLLLHVDAKTNRVVDKIRYAAPVPADAVYRPATALAIGGQYAWVGIDDSAGTVDEPTLVRVNLETGKVRPFTDRRGLGVDVIAATDRDVWLGGSGVQHFDPTTNRVVAATIPLRAIATTGVQGLDPQRCSVPQATPRRAAPESGAPGSPDRDPRPGPRLSAAELGRVDYSSLVVSDLPPAFDVPPKTTDLAGTPFRFVLCNQLVAGPATYPAGLDYGRGGPESVRQRVSGWTGNQANEIFDRARRIAAGCKTKTIGQTTFVPIAPPSLPDDLGDEHLVLSRATKGSGLIFNDLLIRRGQFLYLVGADSVLPDLAAKASDTLDRAPAAT